MALSPAAATAAPLAAGRRPPGNPEPEALRPEVPAGPGAAPRACAPPSGQLRPAGPGRAPEARGQGGVAAGPRGGRVVASCGAARPGATSPHGSPRLRTTAPPGAPPREGRRLDSAADVAVVTERPCADRRWRPAGGHVCLDDEGRSTLRSPRMLTWRVEARRATARPTWRPTSDSTAHLAGGSTTSDCSAHLATDVQAALLTWPWTSRLHCSPSDGRPGCSAHLATDVQAADCANTGHPDPERWHLALQLWHVDRQTEGLSLRQSLEAGGSVLTAALPLSAAWLRFRLTATL
ncbi:translation initiation factor IF-2-like [Elephas maximus indicus]|uniref:translation initiation factor IF-2-like n=1 Tax=Elephas maximus indicus TaxID=99487 RepID=UPI002116A297|nr:translation initiation factor IF-2-like [Elephas maximus indicus]